MKKTIFETGYLSTTAGIYNAIKEFPQFALFCQASLDRHKNKDWGDLSQEDKVINDSSLINDERIISRYDLPQDDNFPEQIKIYIITEWDRSLTTILFPFEY